MKHELVLGSTNPGKAKEISPQLAMFGIRVLTLADLGRGIDVVEDGESFAENACKKATEQARFLERWVLAEDSGLEVAALDGRPGIFSARFAGENATDEENNRLLLEQLEGMPLAKRNAHYTCHAALADEKGNIRAEAHAICRGRITEAHRGTNGFGYDPLFEIPEYHRTFGELGPTVKQTLSHRGRAMRQIIPQVVALLLS